MVDVERLLADCLRDARAASLGVLPLAPEGAAYAEARRTFLAAGLRALRDDLPETGWVQLGLAPAPDAWPALYRRLAEAARELLGSGWANDFFFMHKPPGLRIRFHTGRPADVPALRAELLRRFDRRCGARTSPTDGVYEPETYLFGGPRAMPLVHALFTADSLAWLDHLASRAEGGPQAGADWRVSLTLLRATLDGLGVVGWEHRGVWQVAREETGRRLVGGLRDASRQGAAAGIRAYWNLSREDQLGVLPDTWRTIVRDHQDAARQAASRWRTDYFEAGDATVGPRRAAAHHAIFHWNRGRFSLARQSLLVEALFADAPDPDDTPDAPRARDREAC
ncbi:MULTISPECIES: thiopeptide-type bacteriocin biosynthesis protein [Streptomyces]|uniref:thiopeptide-type bacteriocin biosynthesis protein n=1 Tax=Streptomyces TaxID=1883 RepID=UPI001E48A885|nr:MULTISPECIES: thiopeptide-type bacteriocin biosynthesis protein [Streptomyces]UFQ19322.1 thiopeptide-type bacteriocin biosynthesis protein [Streptomyces huasconensis]WCL88942.1 thiopeptide-type bacteriocin biosynthesis protein [Streptomyces sp. JCM 35825]